MASQEYWNKIFKFFNELEDSEINKINIEKLDPDIIDFINTDYNIRLDNESEIVDIPTHKHYLYNFEEYREIKKKAEIDTNLNQTIKISNDIKIIKQDKKDSFNKENKQNINNLLNNQKLFESRDEEEIFNADEYIKLFHDIANNKDLNDYLENNDILHSFNIFYNKTNFLILLYNENNFSKNKTYVINIDENFNKFKFIEKVKDAINTFLKDYNLEEFDFNSGINDINNGPHIIGSILFNYLHKIECSNLINVEYKIDETFVTLILSIKKSTIKKEIKLLKMIHTRESIVNILMDEIQNFINDKEVKKLI